MVLAKEMQGVADFDWEDGVEERYIRVEGLGGGEQAAHKGGGTWLKTKTELLGLGFG